MSEETKNAMLNLMLCMAKDYKEKHPEECKDEDWPDDEDGPVLYEDCIADILNEHRGEEILIYYTDNPSRYRYYEYENDKSVVFTIYDALENHTLVTVGGANIVDL